MKSPTTMQRESRPVSGWAGSSRLARMTTWAVMLGLLVSAAGIAHAQQGLGDASAEIRIALPPGAPSPVAVSPGMERVVVDLPQGASLASSHDKNESQQTEATQP